VSKRAPRNRMSDSELQHTFQVLDDRFFDGYLQRGRTQVTFGSNKTCESGLGCTDQNDNKIYINIEVRKIRRVIVLILLHEMVHAKLFLEGYVGYEKDGGHEMLFHAGIDRLYRQGAFEGLL
jgi:hypothetical protein